MRKFLCIWMLGFGLSGFGQTAEAKLESVIKGFHQLLVDNNTVAIDRITDKALSYGHSNGWVETKADLIRNLETGYLDYNSYKEDSLQVVINGRTAHARFVADINVALNGKEGNYHLKVLEVWVKKGSNWILFARQALK